MPVGGKARLCGVLELSRALGDLEYRGKGLVADPEASGPWSMRDILRMGGCSTDHAGTAATDSREQAGSDVSQPCVWAKEEHSHKAESDPWVRPGAGALLVLASDGVYEALTPQEVSMMATIHVHLSSCAQQVEHAGQPCWGKDTKAYQHTKNLPICMQPRLPEDCVLISRSTVTESVSLCSQMACMNHHASVCPRGGGKPVLLASCPAQVCDHAWGQLSGARNQPSLTPTPEPPIALGGEVAGPPEGEQSQPAKSKAAAGEEAQESSIQNAPGLPVNSMDTKPHHTPVGLPLCCDCDVVASSQAQQHPGKDPCAGQVGVNKLAVLLTTSWHYVTDCPTGCLYS